MASIFISYSRQYSTFAQKLATSLSNLGADVWIDIEDIPAGLKWSKAIQKGLDGADVMLVIITPESMASDNVEDEWQYFIDQHKPVIPLLLVPAKVSFQLSRIQYIDFNKQDYEVALEQLQAELAGKGIALNPITTGKINPSSPQQEPLPRRHTNQQRQFSPSRRLIVGSVLTIFVISIIAIVIIQSQPPVGLPTPTSAAAATATPATVESAAISFTQTPTAPPATPTPTDTPSLTPTLTTTPQGGGGQIAFMSNRDGQYKIYLMDADGKNVQPLINSPVDESIISWSPDSSKIAFAKDNHIYVIDSNGRNVNQLSSGDSIDQDPIWSPDGQMIGFSSNVVGSQRDIFVMNADGSNRRQLTNSDAEDRRVSWSTDGKQIVFHSNRSGNYALYLVDADSDCVNPDTCEKNFRRLSALDAIYGSFPDWSPDGSRITFHSNYQSDGGPSDYNIAIVDADGLNRYYVAADIAEDRRPVWSPDGQQIIFQSLRDGSDFEIYRLDLETDSTIPLTDNTSEDINPTWRPGG